MSNYNFTYDIPDNFKNILIKTMNLNGVGELTKFIENCRMSFDDLGFAHYAGMHGDTWNKCAVNVIIEAPFNSIEKLKQNRKIIKEWIQKTLKPNESGYLVKNIDFIVIDDNMDVELPNSTEDTLITLTNDIYNALSKKRPL